MDFQKFNPDIHNCVEVAKLVAKSTDYHNLTYSSSSDLLDNLSKNIAENQLNFENIHLLIKQSMYLGIIIFSYQKKSNSLFYDLKFLLTLKLNQFFQRLYFSLVKNDIKMTDHDVYLDLIYIQPGFRNKGIGTKSINYLIELVKLQSKKQILLHVDRANLSARSFYEKLGFKYMMNNPGASNNVYLAMSYNIR